MEASTRSLSQSTTWSCILVGNRSFWIGISISCIVGSSSIGSSGSISCSSIRVGKPNSLQSSQRNYSLGYIKSRRLRWEDAHNRELGIIQAIQSNRKLTTLRSIEWLSNVVNSFIVIQCLCRSGYGFHFDRDSRNRCSNITIFDTYCFCRLRHFWQRIVNWTLLILEEDFQFTKDTVKEKNQKSSWSWSEGQLGAQHSTKKSTILCKYKIFLIRFLPKAN